MTPMTVAYRRPRPSACPARLRTRVLGLLGPRASRRARCERGHRHPGAPVAAPAWVAGLVPLPILAVAIGLFVALDAPGLDRIGVPEEELTVERTVLRPGEIELHVRNDGADPVEVRQVIVNDGFVKFSSVEDKIGRLGGARSTVQYPWIEGQAYEVALLTATGATIDHAIDAAVETPEADLGFYGLMALIGLYVGVIPVAIGMLWLPWLRTVDARWMRFLLAFTIGLLAFLGIDALARGHELAGTGPESLGGAALVWLGAAGAYLALAADGGWLRAGSRGAAPPAAAIARRSWSRSASGSTTSGRGSRSARPTPSARSRSARRWWSALRFTTRPRALRSSRPWLAGESRAWSLALLGLLAGAPAVLGAWIGASAFHPSLAALMFGIGAGAIAQVIVQIAPDRE